MPRVAQTVLPLSHYIDFDASLLATARTIHVDGYEASIVFPAAPGELWARFLKSPPSLRDDLLPDLGDHPKPASDRHLKSGQS